MRNPSVWLFAVSLAAASCAKTSSIGTSGHKEPDTTPPTAPAKPKLPSMISGGPATSVGYNQPILGDVDGDGFDDFLIQGATHDLSGATPGTTSVYLFYGKESFASQIDTSQADAIFESELTGAWALGDINGDGFADFSIAQPDNSFDLVFGSRRRYAGHYATHSVGTKWVGERLPSPFDTSVPTLTAIRGAGDVNGDGIDDLLVTYYWVSADEQIESIVGFGLVQTDYVVHGHTGDWPSSAWDASIAAAWLGTETSQRPEAPAFSIRSMLQGLPVGDLDGDGYADLVGAGKDAVFVFYGGKDRLTGALDASVADAALKLPPQEESEMFETELGFLHGRQLVSLGDLDGDGATDLGLFIGFDLRVSYGASWSGTRELPSDFVIQTSASNEGMLGAAAAGDIDTDDFPDLALLTAVYPKIEETFDENGEVVISTERPRGRLYVLRGTGQRALGVHRLNADDVRVAGNETNPGGAWGPPSNNPLPTMGALLSMAGDVDGDGSCDILTGNTSDPYDPNLPESSVLLIPSTPRAPD